MSRNSRKPCDPKQLLKQVQAALQGAGLEPLPCKQAAEKLPALIAQFESRPENRDASGRRVLNKPRERVRRTLKQLARAAAACADPSPVGQNAHKLLRGIRTFPEFEALEKKASAFIGTQNSLVRRRNERKKREGEPIIPLDSSLALRRIDTVEHLKTTGKKLKLCVAHHRRYHQDLRDRSLVFWSIQRDGEEIGLLSINPDDNEVDQCNGFGNEPLGLNRAIMLKILRELNVTADDQESFSSVGALSLFLERPAKHPDADPDAEADFQGSFYQAWGKNGQLAICQDQRHWSSFRYCSKFDTWEGISCEGVTLGQFVNLIAHCPEIAKLVREQCAAVVISPEQRTPRRPPLRQPHRRRRRHLAR